MASRSSQQRPEVMNSFRTPHGFFTSGSHDQQPLPPPQQQQQQQQLHSYQHQQQPQQQQQQQHEQPYSGLNLSFDTDFDLTLGGNLPLGHGSSHHGDTSKMPVAPTSAKPERADHRVEPKFQGANYYNGQYVINSKNGISASNTGNTSASINTNHNWKPASITTQLQGDRLIEPEYDISAYMKPYDVGATSSGNSLNEHDTPSDWVRNKNVTTPRKPVATSIDLGDDLSMARMESLLKPTMEVSKPTRPAKATSLRSKRPITEPLPQQQQHQEQRQQQQQPHYQQQQQQQQHQNQQQQQQQQQQQLPPQHQHQYLQHQQPVLQPQRNQVQQRHDSSSDFFDASWSNPLPQAPQRPSITSSISSSSTAHVGLRNPSVFTSFTSEYPHAGAISRGASVKSAAQSSISASPTTPTSPTSPTLPSLLYSQPPHPLMAKQAPAPSAPPVPSPTPYLPPISGVPEPHVALRASRSSSSRAPPLPQPSATSRRNDMPTSSNSPSPSMHPVLTSMTTAGYTSEYGGFKASDLPSSSQASSRESASPPGGSPALDSVPTLQSFSFSAAPVQVPASTPLQVSVPNSATVPLSAPPRTTLASKTVNTSSRRQYPEPTVPRIDSHAQIHQPQFSYNSYPQRSSSTSIPPQQAPPPPPLPASLPQPTFEGRAHISHKSAQPAPVLTHVPAPAPAREPSPPVAVVPGSTYAASHSQNTSHQTVPSSPWLDHDSDILRITQSQFQSQPPYPSVQLPVTTVNSHIQRQSSSRQAQREQSQSKQSQPSSQVKPLEPLDLMEEWGRPNQQRQPNLRDQFEQPIHSTPLDRIESSGRQEQSKKLNLLEDSRLQGQPKPLDLLEQLEQPGHPKPSKRVDLNELKSYSQFDLLEHIDLREHTEGWNQPERPDSQKQQQQSVQSRQPISHLEQLDLLMQPTLQEQPKQSKRSNQSSQPKPVNQQEQLEPKVELKKDLRNELEKGLKADKKKEPKKESRKELTNDQRSEQKREQKKEPKKEQDRTKASRSSTPVQTQKKPSRSPPLDYDAVEKEPQDMESSTPPLPIKKDQQDMVPESTVNKSPPTGSSPESSAGLTAYPPPPPTILYSDDQITISSVHLTIHAFYFPLNTPVTIPLLSITEIEVLRPEGKSGGVAGWLNYKNWGMTAALTDVWWARDPRRSATGAFTPSSILPFGFGVSAGNTPPIHVIVRVKDEWLRKGFGVKGEQGVQVLQEAWKNVRDSQQGLRPLQPTVSAASLDDIEEDGAMVERPTGEHTNDGSERRRRKNQHANNTWTAYPFPNDSPVYLAQQPRRAGALLPADCGDEPELIDYDEVDEEI